VRVAYLFSRTPRWGGSYAEMDAYAASAPVEKNARLRVLAGYADYDRADLLLRSDPRGALQAIERACALGENWQPYRSVATWYLWRSLDPIAVEY
jgi:3-methyladenine DNA glycosylase/8-oxoguanine DNA glycosylase